MACAVTTVLCRTRTPSCHGACSVPDLATVKNVTQDWKKCGDTALQPVLTAGALSGNLGAKCPSGGVPPGTWDQGALGNVQSWAEIYQQSEG